MSHSFEAAHKLPSAEDVPDIYTTFENRKHVVDISLWDFVVDYKASLVLPGTRTDDSRRQQSCSRTRLLQPGAPVEEEARDAHIQVCVTETKHDHSWFVTQETSSSFSLKLQYHLQHVDIQPEEGWQDGCEHTQTPDSTRWSLRSSCWWPGETGGSGPRRGRPPGGRFSEENTSSSVSKHLQDKVPSPVPPCFIWISSMNYWRTPVHVWTREDVCLHWLQRSTESLSLTQREGHPVVSSTARLVLYVPLQLTNEHVGPRLC